MPVLTTSLIYTLITLLIGIVVGVGFSRYGRNWLGRTVAARTGAADDVTYALVGIAGAFIGFHVAVILGLLPTPLMLFLGALVGALLVVWLWRGR
jgi:hypothetical protein